MLWRSNIAEHNRNFCIEGDDFVLNNESNLYNHSLLNLLRYEKQLNKRRGKIHPPPDWFLTFRSEPISARNTLDKIIDTLVAVGTTPQLAPIHFHTTSGVICRVFTECIRKTDNFDEILPFCFNFRKYMQGTRKSFPTNNVFADMYDLLKLIVKTPYGQRLINSYKEGKELNTQDYILLYKIPLYSYIETVVTALDTEEIVEYLEKYRTFK